MNRFFRISMWTIAPMIFGTHLFKKEKPPVLHLKFKFNWIVYTPIQLQFYTRSWKKFCKRTWSVCHRSFSGRSSWFSKLPWVLKSLFLKNHNSHMVSRAYLVRRRQRWNHRMWPYHLIVPSHQTFCSQSCSGKRNSLFKIFTMLTPSNSHSFAFTEQVRGFFKKIFSSYFIL